MMLGSFLERWRWGLLVLLLVAGVYPVGATTNVAPTISMPTIQAESAIVTFPLGRRSWYINPWEPHVGHLERTGALGAHGENIVLAGHARFPDGSPGVFLNLRDLRVGDPIFVSGRDGTQRRFIVHQLLTVPYTDISVLNGNGQTRLTLITCDVLSQNPETGAYEERLVVIAYPAG